MKTITTVLWLNQAESLCLALECENIKTFMPDLFTAQAHPFLTNVIGGIRIQVSDADYDKGKQIATNFLETQKNTEVDNPERRPEWKCPKCGESVEGSFDACWNCETFR